MEMVVALMVYSMSLAVAGIGFAHAAGSLGLGMTRDTLMWNIRWLQTRAYETDEFTYLNLERRTPAYRVYQGLSLLKTYQFENGVSYRNGGLEFPTTQVFYGVNADCKQGGTIRLVDSYGDSENLVLYLFSGLAVKEELAHDPS